MVILYYHDTWSTLKHSLPQNIVALSFKFIKQNLRDSLTKKTKVRKDRSTKFRESTVFIPTFWRTILNILDFQQPGMIKIIRTVQALF